MNRVKLPHVSRSQQLLAKGFGGLFWFWMLWRLKHDWKTLFSHYEADKVWVIPDQVEESERHH